jgi:hypothetical protein
MSTHLEIEDFTGGDLMRILRIFGRWNDMTPNNETSTKSAP